DQERTVREIRNALGLIDMAYGGDGYYIHTPMKDKREMTRLTERLYWLLRELNDERVERIVVHHPHGTTNGLLHFPKQKPADGSRRYPALLALHPISGDKDSFDCTLALFREAGYATFCIDLPAHGENFDGPRLQYDDEVAGAAALEMLAAHPEIDPDRLGVMGGSLGAFFAQRTAAASPLVKACLAYASPFDAGKGLPEAVFGIQDVFAHVIGAPTMEASFEMAKPFHLREAAAKTRCPVALVHGMLDHICDFTATYEIARRVKSSISVFPLVGVNHEAAQPGTAGLAGPGIEWLKGVL
ncbi:MAG: alpha/beta fold hydrolase, partial [Chloroflexota bacterium]